MPKISPREASEKWARRTKAATQDVAAGVDRVTENPADKAIAALDKMQAAFLEAMASGKVEAGLNRVTLEGWKSAMKNIGVQRIAAGVDAKGIKKWDAFAAEFFPFLEKVSAELDRMPDTTFEDSVQRAVHQMRRTHEFQRGK